MKLLPFDLSKALAGEKVVTRDGRTVKIAGKITYDKNEGLLYSNKELLGMIGTKANWATIYNTVFHWDINGRSYGQQDSENDLFMAEPGPKKAWLLIIDNSDLKRDYLCQIHTTLQKAEEAKKDHEIFGATAIIQEVELPETSITATLKKATNEEMEDLTKALNWQQLTVEYENKIGPALESLKQAREEMWPELTNDELAQITRKLKGKKTEKTHTEYVIRRWLGVASYLGPFDSFEDASINAMETDTIHLITVVE